MKLKHGLTLILFALAMPSMAQPMFYFRNMDVNDGLTSNSISSFCEDQQGFMWIGTRDGLVRYDGVFMEQFYHDPTDPNSLGSNSISWDMKEDNKGRLWIALHGYGLSRYDPRTDDFTNFSYSQGIFEHEWTNNAEQVIIAPDQSVYLICQMGIVHIDTSDNVTTVHSVDPNSEEGSPSNFRFAHMHGNRWIWFTSSKGLRRYDILKDAWEYPGHNPEGLSIFNTEWGCSGAGYGNGILYFGTYWRNDQLGYRQLYSYDIEADRLDSVEIAPELPKDDPFCDKLHDIEVATDGTVWMGTDDLGILKYYPGSGSWHQYANNGDWSGSLLPGPVRSLYTDSHNNLWIGTTRGISLMAPKRQYFKNYSQVVSNDGKVIPLSKINTLVSGTDDDIWLGKEAEGLLHLNADKQFIGTIRSLYPSKSDYSSYIEPVLIKGDTLIGHVWFEGLCRRTISTDKVLSYHPITDNAHGELRMARLSASGNVYAWGWGRFGRLNLATGKYDFLIPPINTDNQPDFVWDVTEDMNGKLWVGLGQMGMICVDPTTMTIVDSWNRDTTRFSKTSVWRVLHRQGKIYFSLSAEGLGVYDIETGQLETLSKKDGLCSDDINGLILDNQDDLWIYSPSGISWFDERNKRFRSFSEVDGMISEHVKDAELLSNGNILMITDRGLVEFNPTELKKEDGKRSPSLRSIQVYDDPINIYQWNHDSATVNVPYDRNYLRVEFSALEFFDPEKIQFAYRLAGAEQRWNYTDHRPVAIYTNLRGGHYRLCVKRTNVDGIWGPELCVPVFVTTPFYYQIWFIVLIIALLGFLSYMIYRWQLNRKLAVLEVRNRLSRDLHDDIGSALSSINIYSTVAQQQIDNDTAQTKKLLERMGTSARRMMQSMDDIIWTIDPTNDQVLQLMARMRQFAGPILEAKDIDFILKVDESVKTLKLDMVKRRNLFLVFKESVNNAAKYSQATQAKVILEHVAGELIFILEDNGKGFDTMMETDRHGLKNMHTRAEEVNGTLTVHSVKEKGTTVRMSIPLG